MIIYKQYHCSILSLFYIKPESNNINISGTSDFQGLYGQNQFKTLYVDHPCINEVKIIRKINTGLETLPFNIIYM